MIKLKQVVHYPNTNSVESTWVDSEGNQVRCHSYADVQMDMLQADLGDNASEYAGLIATVEANIKPSDPLPPVDYSAQRLQDYRNEADPMFFKYQAGESTIDLWLAKRAEIKARWPL